MAASTGMSPLLPPTPSTPTPTPPAPTPFACKGGLPNGTWYAYVPDWTLASDTRAIVSRGNQEGHACAGKGALLKQCAQESTSLPPSAMRCVPTNTTIELAAPAVPMRSKPKFLIVTPKPPLMLLPP